MNRSVDYDSIASAYDQRYERSDYGPVLELLLNFVRGTKGQILEVGCGSGHWLHELAKCGYHVTGLDPSRNMLQTALQKGDSPIVVQARAEAVPWREAVFDRVFCLNSLHHFSDREGFLAQARRVLRTGGGFLTVGLDPHAGLDRWWIYDYFPQVIEIDRKRYLPTTRIRALMAENGFKECATFEALHMPIQLSAREALESGRLAKATTSQLSVLTDAEYDRGIRRLVEDIEAAEAKGATLTIGADLRLYATTGWLR